MQKNNQPVQPEIVLQSLLRPAYFPSISSKDCREFQETVQRLDGVIVNSGLEDQAIQFGLEGFDTTDASQRRRRASVAVIALRTVVLRVLLGNPSFRKFSETVGSSDLLADFCRVREIDQICRISKSALERYSKFFSEEQVRKLHQGLTEICGNPAMTGKIGLEEEFDTTECLFDSTCIEANIHFPVDWVLLRDVSRTLLKAMELIRNAGVRNRMAGEGPKQLMREMNRLCIEMAQMGRSGMNSRNKRKRVFREMKRLLRRIEKHALRHSDLFATHWEETGYSHAQRDRILERMNTMLAQIPQVIRQANDRIIEGKTVANDEKVLSVYEEDIHVIKRGKAGRDVEFGNTLMLCEGLDGYILDWQFYKERAPEETEQMRESLRRQGDFNLPTAVESVCSDRGFNSKEHSEWLERHEIFDATCPRSSHRLKEKLKNARFTKLQRRRGGTEGRIGIFKNRFHRGGLRAKGIENRTLAIAWTVVGHNLWMLSRRLAAEERARWQAAHAA